MGRLHPDDRERVLSAHPTPYAIEHLQLDYRFQRKDGSWFWVRDEKRLVRDAGVAGRSGRLLVGCHGASSGPSAARRCSTR